MSYLGIWCTSKFWDGQNSGSNDCCRFFFPRDPVFGTCPGHQNKDQRWLDIRHLVNNKTLKWKIFGDSDGVPKQFSILRQVSKLQERSQLLSTFEGAVRPNDTGARRGEASLLGRIEAQKLQFWEREFKMGHACSGLGVKSDFTSGQAIPSLGSYGHPNICRRPCILMMRGTCQKGADCGFCHLAHDA